MIRRNIQKACDALRSAAVDFQIRAKWATDRKSLPLTPEHRELYEIIHRFLWKELRRLPKLVACEDFNDRIQWLKLFDQRHETITCTDKIRLRDYVNARLGTGYCPQIYQIAERFDDIAFESLPERYVIKTSHDWGRAIVVNSRMPLDKEAARQNLTAALQREFGRERGEWAYRFIKPRILVEEFIDCGTGRPPPDFKFICVDGSIKFVHFLSDRDNGLKEQVIDIDGHDMGTPFLSYIPYGSDFTVPPNWYEMKSCAEKLSKGWKLVRVDLYYAHGKVYVGEMTFFPGGGAYPGAGQRELGQLLDFDRSTVMPIISHSLDAETSARGLKD